jgi:hypothetical protein
MAETRANDRRPLLLAAVMLIALGALWLGVSAVLGAGSPAPPAAPIGAVGGGEFFSVSNDGARAHHGDGDCPFKDGSAPTFADV